MKTLKIIAVITLVALAASLLIASAYAYTGGRMGTSTTQTPPQQGDSLRGAHGWNDGHRRYDEGL